MDNSANSLWLNVTNIGVLLNGTNRDIVANIVANAFLPKTAEVFYYDADRNLTGDGRWTNSWDGENRLVKLTSLTNGPSGSKRRLSFNYDYQGRRVSKQVETWNGSAWSVTLSNKFVYDGWNLIAELNGTNNAVIRSYLWGRDLSGATQGAGGVGGLLAVKNEESGVQSFVAFDGNGNVAALVNAADGSVSASYEYGPFGEVSRRAGSVAAANPIRFSTKYQDDETDYLYYGYRYYNPSTGRWVNRDYADEQVGGINLFAYVNNRPINEEDFLGLAEIDFASDSVTQTDPSGFPWVTKSEFNSGPRSSGNASYSQAAVDIFSLYGFSHPNGFCNTGQHDSAYFGSIRTHHVGSFVQAFMKNPSACCIKATVRCKFRFTVVMSSSAKTFAVAALQGHLLEKSYKTSDQLTRFVTKFAGGTTGVSGTYNDSSTTTVQMKPEETRELYNIYPSIAGWRRSPGGFIEAVIATCELLSTEPCDK